MHEKARLRVLGERLKNPATAKSNVLVDMHSPFKPEQVRLYQNKETWMKQIITYLEHDVLPSDTRLARSIAAAYLCSKQDSRLEG